jgi:hypothetical protein
MLGGSGGMREKSGENCFKMLARPAPFIRLLIIFINILIFLILLLIFLIYILTFVFAYYIIQAVL